MTQRARALIRGSGVYRSQRRLAAMATLNCPGVSATDGAVHSTVRAFAPGDAKNVLVRFNPETKKFLTWPVPGGGGTVRNMDIDKSGNL